MTLFHFVPDCEGSNEAFVVAEDAVVAKDKLLALKRKLKDNPRLIGNVTQAQMNAYYDKEFNETIDEMVNERGGYRIVAHPAYEVLFL